MPAANTLIPALLQSLGVDASGLSGSLAVHSPIDGTLLASLTPDTADTVTQKIAQAQAAFQAWRLVPAPARGELIRLLGEELRAAKTELGQLVTLEAGKILSAGLQELGTGAVAESRATFETLTAEVKELASTKSPTEFLRLQGELAKKHRDIATDAVSRSARGRRGCIFVVVHTASVNMYSQ